MRLRSDGVGDAATRRQHGTAVTSTARPQSDQRNAQAVAGHDVIDLIESKNRQPSLGEAADAAGAFVCGWRSTTVAAAPDAIRRLVMLARRALGRSECDTLEIEGRAADQALSFERVARLRDEIHVTANRLRASTSTNAYSDRSGRGADRGERNARPAVLISSSTCPGSTDRGGAAAPRRLEPRRPDRRRPSDRR